MRANEYIGMWENSRRMGQPLRVGKLVGVEGDELNGKRCTKYSFALEDKDRTASLHLLRVLVREQHGRPEIPDFSNWGW